MSSYAAGYPRVGPTAPWGAAAPLTGVGAARPRSPNLAQERAIFKEQVRAEERSAKFLANKLQELCTVQQAVMLLPLKVATDEIWIRKLGCDESVLSCSTATDSVSDTPTSWYSTPTT